MKGMQRKISSGLYDIFRKKSMEPRAYTRLKWIGVYRAGKFLYSLIVIC